MEKFSIDLPAKKDVGFASERIRVLIGSSLGTIFEKYDFYIYAALASEMGTNFFFSLPPNFRFIMALITFGIGFALRPFGAIVFGYLGDRIGRKYTFLITITLMGGSTFLIGCLPKYETIGVAAPILLIFLRCCQGLSVGGEYGGAVTYVAEHSPHEKRGLYTGLLNATSSAGFCLSIVVVIICRSCVRADVFMDWAWRIPFLISIFLLILSIFIRMKLEESPVFTELKSAGLHSKSPIKDTFCNGQNVLVMLIALFGALAGETVVGYGSHVYAFYFLTQNLKIDSMIASIMLAIVLFITMIENAFFGWLSDKVGRKLLTLLGLFLGIIMLYPAYRGFTYFGNYQLQKAMHESPVFLVADSDECNFMFVPSEFKEHIRFKTSCDLMKNLLSRNGIPYENIEAPRGAIAKVVIGKWNLTSLDVNALSDSDAQIAHSNITSKLSTILKLAGYPQKSDIAQINIPMLLLIWIILITGTAMSYGCLAAWLVELFPTKIRYTSLSVSYHISSGLLGGFLPTIGFALVSYTGNIYAGVFYPIVVATMTCIVGLLCLKETKNVDIRKSDQNFDIIKEMPIIRFLRSCKRIIFK